MRWLLTALLFSSLSYAQCVTVDTSNPILVGAEGVRYTDNGLDFKPKEKLEHYFEMDLSDRLEDIIFNVNKFKSFIK